jgi:hypothetical protein
VCGHSFSLGTREDGWIQPKHVVKRYCKIRNNLLHVDGTIKYCSVIHILYILSNKYVLRWGLLTPRPTTKLEGHPLSAVRDCLFNIFAAVLHIWSPSPLSATRGRAMLWWQWTHLTWEEHRLRVFENRVLRKIFGPKRDEVTWEWRKLNNEELHMLYSSPNIRQNKSRRMRWAGHVARMRKERTVYTVLMGKPEGKRPLGRPRRRWEQNGS